MRLLPETVTNSATDLTARDDGTLLPRVEKALFGTGYPELQRVRVTGHEGFVALRGSVTTYYQKQLAQETAKRVDGVGLLKNEIVVC